MNTPRLNSHNKLTHRYTMKENKLSIKASQIPAESPSRVTRRQFLAGASVAALAGISIVPSHVLGADDQPAPSERLNLAGVGIGGVGHGQLQELEKAGFRIAALCDVDEVYAKKTFDIWPQARRYRDFREMLETEADKIDAVYVGTPDHSHASITLAALRKKKAVVCVKPLTRTVQELRVVTEAVRKAGVATQVTAAPNTDETACRTCELIGAGAIGQVREVHIWSNRPWWPQGMRRPPGADAIPATLDWKLWLGPAPERPFKDVWPGDALEMAQINAYRNGIGLSRGVYHPFNFRGWWVFGTGALGDMGCHHFNTPFRALQLGYPITIQATASRLFEETAPLASMVTYDYPARAGMPPVRVIWYDGGLKPATPRQLGDQPLGDEGVIYVGDEGKMLGRDILDPAREKKFKDVPKTLERRGGTWKEFMEACKGGQKAGCNFDWAGPLTETVLLGNAAIRREKCLAYDATAMKFTNDEKANLYLAADYRNGWKLEE